jgi:Protein of unknown function (DUF2934)
VPFDTRGGQRSVESEWAVPLLFQILRTKSVHLKSVPLSPATPQMVLMIYPKIHTQPPTIVVVPKNSPGNVRMMPDTIPSQDTIRKRAYELYESRGREPGQDEQDWVRAEQEILKQER